MSLRETFEAAVIERFKESGYLEVQIRVEVLPRDGDGYYDGSIDAYWDFYQMGAAAVVVELPKRANGTTLDLPGGDGENDYLLPEKHVLTAIAKAGGTVKP